MAIENRNIVAFANTYMKGDLSLFEKAEDLYNHFRTDNGVKNLPYDSKVSFSEKCKQMHEDMIKEIKNLAGIPHSTILAPEAYFSHPNYKWATFAIIGALIDPIIPDTIIDSIGMFTNVQTGDYGNSFAFDIESNDLFYVTKGGRGMRHAEGQKTFRGQVPIIPINHDITTMVSLYRLLSGKENLALFAMKCARAMETEMAYEAYSAFNSAMLALPTTTNYELKYSGFTTDSFIKLTDKVGSYNNGNKPIAIGTRSAVNKVLPSDSNYRYSLDSDYVKLGYIKEFNGIDILVLPQKANWKTPYSTLLNDSALYVMSPASQKPVQLAIEGSTMTIADGVYDNANLTQQVTFKKSWGVEVATNATFGMIELS